MTKTYMTIILACLLLGVVPAAAQVLNLSCGTHETGTPSADPLIRFVWEAPAEMPDADYYGLFDTDETFVFDDLNTSDLSVFSGTTYEADMSELSPDGESRWFHVAPADEEGEIGSTTTAGPYQIDTAPPSDADVSLPETTSERIVTLTLAATGATEMFISSIGHDGADGQWEEMAETREWSLSGSGGDTGVYVRFRDAAGNTADASAMTNYLAGDLNCDGVAALDDLILVFQVITGSPATNIPCLSDTNDDGQIGTEELAFLLRHIAD